MIISRRSFLRTLLHGLGAWYVTDRLVSFVEAGQKDAIQSGPLTVRVSRPFDAETPVREFTTWVTPNEQFFVRSHFGPPNPELINASSWRLHVGGLVDRELTLSLGDLKQIPAVTIPAVLQCSGNGRAYHRPKVPGVQWERGAVGNAEWTGVRL